jgi:glycine betaine/proline transport system substrate-binding protein
MKRIILAFAVSALVVGFQFIFFKSAHAACGKVTISDMNWASATLMANVDRLILKHGYGCDAELIPGDTVPTGTSMIEKGQPDIAPELWTNSFTVALQRGVHEKRLRIAGKSLSDGGNEGFWVPKYLVDKDPSLATLKGVMKNAKLFKHPEDLDKSAFIGCPSGWACQITSGHLFKAFKLGALGFDLIDPGSAAGLDGSLTRAYERGLPWFGYYWSPTPLLGKYKMVKVDFGVGVDIKHWKSCITQAECPDPKPSAYPISPVRTVTTEKFAAASSDAYLYLTRRSFTNAQMNSVLSWVKDNQADGETAALYFLKNRLALWSAWVPDSISSKVKHAIAGM